MLILLPGLICDASIYTQQTGHFRDSMAIDGYGMRDTLEGMAQYVLEQAPARFDLFGHSMGGRIALEIIRAAPHRVRRLALASTGVHPLRQGEVGKRFDLRRIGREQGMEALTDAWLPPMLAPDHRTNPAIVEPLRAMCIGAGQKVFEAQTDALIARAEVASLLDRITCPTLVMTGRRDEWSTPEQHEKIAAAIPDAEIVIIEGAGHMIPAEAPQEVNSAIAQWLNRQAAD